MPNSDFEAIEVGVGDVVVTAAEEGSKKFVITNLRPILEGCILIDTDSITSPREIAVPVSVVDGADTWPPEKVLGHYRNYREKIGWPLSEKEAVSFTKNLLLQLKEGRVACDQVITTQDKAS